MGTKTFRGRSLEDVDEAADAWLAANPQLKNVQMHALGVRSAEGGQPAKDAGPDRARHQGRWSIVLSFED